MLLALPLGPLPALAAESVLLLESPALRPELCVALRIQLTGVASLECRAEAAAEAPLAERLDAASALVAEQGATLGVLIERDPDPRLVRMVLVGTRADEVVLAIERIENREDPDVDRSLALKVRDALDVMVATRAEVTEQRALPALLTPPADVSAPPHPSAASYALLLEAGAALSMDQRARAAAVVGAGVRLRRQALYGELGVTLQRHARIHDVGDIKQDEWGASLGARVGRMFRRVGVGGTAELGLARFDATGVTSDGNRGSDTRRLLRLAVGIDMRVLLLPSLTLRFAPGLAIYPEAQHYALDEQVLERGHVRAFLPLSLMVDLPLIGRGGRDAN